MLRGFLLFFFFEAIFEYNFRIILFPYLNHKCGRENVNFKIKKLRKLDEVSATEKWCRAADRFFSIGRSHLRRQLLRYRQLFFFLFKEESKPPIFSCERMRKKLRGGGRKEEWRCRRMKGGKKKAVCEKFSSIVYSNDFGSGGRRLHSAKIKKNLLYCVWVCFRSEVLT